MQVSYPDRIKDILHRLNLPLVRKKYCKRVKERLFTSILNSVILVLIVLDDFVCTACYTFIYIFFNLTILPSQNNVEKA